MEVTLDIRNNQWEEVIRLLVLLRALPEEVKGVLQIDRLFEHPRYKDLAPIAQSLTRLLEGKASDADLELIDSKLGFLATHTSFWNLQRREEDAKKNLGQAIQELQEIEILKSLHTKVQREVLKQPPIPEEVLELARKEITDEEVIARLKDIKEKGGFELSEFIQDLEKVVHDSGRLIRFT